MTPYLEARNLVKRFGHVEALRGADFDVALGEVVALVGDNGAGKSTLVKVLSGVLQPDEGSLYVEGEPVVLSSPFAAREHGIETVYQDLALAADLTPAANLFMGRELRKPGLLGKVGVLDNARMAAKARELLSDFTVHLPNEDARISDLSGGQRQSVAVARAAAWASKVVFLDEPTAALGVAQTEAVRKLILRIKSMGRGIVLISHNMPEVLNVADRVQVFRGGKRVAHFVREEATIESLVTAMTSGT